jgi:hypothetical protein
LVKGLGKKEKNIYPTLFYPLRVLLMKGIVKTLSKGTTKDRVLTFIKRSGKGKFDFYKSKNYNL